MIGKGYFVARVTDTIYAECEKLRREGIVTRKQLPGDEKRLAFMYWLTGKGKEFYGVDG